MATKIVFNPFTRTFQKIVDESTLPGGGSADFVEDDLTSQIDGIKTTFTLSNTAIAGTIKAFVNGNKLRKGVGLDFVETSTTQITINGDILQVGEILVAEYQK